MIVSRILSFICVLSLIFGCVVEFQLILLDISYDCFDSIFLEHCLIFLFVIFSFFSLFLEIINVRFCYLPRKLWVVLVWLIAFVELFCISFVESHNSLKETSKLKTAEESLVGNSICNWDANMDILLDIYNCQQDSLCPVSLLDMGTFYKHLDGKHANCLLDSLLKTKRNLGFIDLQLLFQIPKSELKISKENFDNIVNEPDSCTRELWMLALSERGFMEYEFKNVCSVKRFESVRPTAEQLNSYWVYEHVFDSNGEKNLLSGFISKNEKLQKKFRVNGLCDGRIAKVNEKGVLVELFVQLKESNRECWIGNRMFPYYVSVNEKFLQFKMTPPARIIGSNEVEKPLFKSPYDDPKLRSIPLLNGDTIFLPWNGWKSDSLNAKLVDKKNYYQTVNLKFPNVVRYESFTKILKGQYMIIDIPCLGEKDAKAYGIFDMIKPDFPVLRCEVAPVEKNYLEDDVKVP